MGVPVLHRPRAENSLWNVTVSPGPDRAPLAGDFRADVGVVGAGLTGVRTASLLADAGVGIVLLERTLPLLAPVLATGDRLERLSLPGKRRVGA